MIKVLSQIEKNLLIKISEDIPKKEIIKFFTLRKEDIINLNKYKAEQNRLGFAIQLCVLRYKSWPFSYVKKVPYVIIKYISEQLKISPEKWQCCKKIRKNKNRHGNLICQLSIN